MTDPSSPGTAEAPPPSVPAHAPVVFPSGSTGDAVQGSLDHARALVALGNPPLAVLNAEDWALREALLVPTYSLTRDIRGSFIDVVRPERTAPELAGSLGFRDTGVSLPLGGTATPDLAALAGPAQLPPSFVYLPVATEDIRALAAGSPSGLRFRDVVGLIHVDVRVPELTLTEARYLDAERALTEARSEAARASTARDAAEKALKTECGKNKTLQAIRTEASQEVMSAKTKLEEVQAQLASRPAAPPGGYVSKTYHDTKIRRLSKRIRKLRVSNQDLRTERRRFRTLLDPSNLFRFFNNQGSPGIMTGASEFQEQLTAYCRSEKPPYLVFLIMQNPAPKVMPVGEVSPSVEILRILSPHYLPASGSKGTESTPLLRSQGNSLLRPVPAGGIEEERQTPVEEKQEEDHPMDPDADPVRPVEELAQVLTRSKVEDVRMDVLEYWQMDTDPCTLTEAEDAIQGRTTEDIVIHVSLRKHILVEFLRRALILSFLDEVPWFQHVPEEFFNRALAEAEDDDWELGVAEGVNPWPSVPLQPRDSPSPSEEEEEASGNERDGNGPDDETSLGKRSRPKSKTPVGKRPKRVAPPTPSPGNTRVRRTSTRLKHQNRGFPDYEVMNDEVHSVAERVPVAEYRDIVKTQAPWDDMFDERVRVLLFIRDTLSQEFTDIAKRYILFMWICRREEWERTHWIVLNRNVEAHALLHQGRAGRQRKYERALKDVRADVATLPPPERKRFRTEAAFWRHSLKPCVDSHGPRANKTLRTCWTSASQLACSGGHLARRNASQTVCPWPSGAPA
ncbi:hypothetical protein PHMEG_00019331 [Phytophthora megakarya]|uniref:Uncharacterized protein n=1 Tax=Phytophthora megakarya TaxID=4795 RepID=A0A225VTN6_9STRA|nr:hypothetical protein PHMEG_00019331 [Phytophthora megakarya]